MPRLPILGANDKINPAHIPTHGHPIADVTGLDAALNARIAATEKGAASGVATLDTGGKVPAGQLPSYVDDVVEYANLAAFPASGTAGVIYVAIDNGKTYRWSGTAYVEISPSDVNSVAGKIGAVTLVPADVGAHPAGAEITEAMLPGTRLDQADLDARYKIVGEVVADEELPARLHSAAGSQAIGASMDIWNISGWTFFDPTAVNAPTAGVEWWLVEYRGDLTNGVQEATAWNSAARPKYQRRLLAGAWAAWERVWETEAELDARYAPIASSTDSGWKIIGAAGQPTFENGWTAFGGGNATPAFRKIGNRVQLFGLCNSGTVVDTTAGNIFTLLAGYRPLEGLHFGVASNNAYGQAYVSSTGEVRAQIGSNVWFSLSGISFLVAD